MYMYKKILKNFNFYQKVLWGLIISAILTGCCLSDKSFDKNDYIIFEPVSISYMKYILDLQDLSGIIEGIEERAGNLEENQPLKEYLLKLKTLNNRFIKTTPPVFSDPNDWKEFCILVEDKNNKPYFYVKKSFKTTSYGTIPVKVTGFLVVDAAGNVMKDYVIEWRSISDDHDISVIYKKQKYL